MEAYVTYVVYVPCMKQQYIMEAYVTSVVYVPCKKQQ